MERKIYGFSKVQIIIAIIITLILFFSLGVLFENWGGIDRLAPVVINFLRNNFFGDEFVLESERKVFAWRDYVKNKFHSSSEEELAVKNVEEKPSNHIQQLKNMYFTDPSTLNQSDFDILTKIVENYNEPLKPILSKPIKGEGFWEQSHISPKTYKPLMVKTFLRTDKERGYSKVYIYKFDMKRLNLEFIPGGDDSSDDICTGRMSRGQRDRVIWAFSGGFQYQHGEYGMKYKGKVLLEPQPGAATIFFYKNGTYGIYMWTRRMKDNDRYLAWRQNESLLVINGEVTPYIDRMWGETPDYVDPIYTVRTGMGFDKNGDLIFAFGEYLSPESLAKGMVAAGVVNGMHLDMNFYNTHLVKFERTLTGKIKSKNENEVLCYYNNIYTYYHPRDYFILTLKRSEDMKDYQFTSSN